jgi:hypothetical protein
VKEASSVQVAMKLLALDRPKVVVQLTSFSPFRCELGLRGDTDDVISNGDI